jgi:hypothetical protein
LQCEITCQHDHFTSTTFKIVPFCCRTFLPSSHITAGSTPACLFLVSLWHRHGLCNLLCWQERVSIQEDFRS